MSIFKTLGLVEDEDKDKKIVEKKKSTPPSSTITPSTTGSIPTSFAQATGVTIDNSEFAKYLDKVFTERNFPGPDYYEFVSGLKNLETAALDERTKFISIFAGLSSVGLTKEKLFETANKYIEIVKEQQDAFKSEIQNKLNTDVVNKEKSLQAIIEENSEIEKKMIELTERKQKNNAEIGRVSQEIAEDRRDLASRETGFDAAVQSFIDKINGNIQKIQMYL